MNSENSGAIVIDSDKEKVEMLKKRWSNVNKVSSTMTSLASSGFVISLLSPFEFDGPVVEIVTAVVAAVGFVMKKVSEVKLNKLDGEEKEIVSEADKSTLLTVTENLGQAVAHRR